MRRVVDRVPADVGDLDPLPARRLTSPGSRASPATHGSTVPGVGRLPRVRCRAQKAAACRDRCPRAAVGCRQGRAGRRACPDETVCSMASASAPTPGTTAPHAAAMTRRVVGHTNLGPRREEPALHRHEVAFVVVDHRYVARHVERLPLVERDTRHPRVAAQGRHRAPEGKGLEGRLDDVVGVLARQQADMEGDSGVGRKGHEETPSRAGCRTCRRARWERAGRRRRTRGPRSQGHTGPAPRPWGSSRPPCSGRFPVGRRPPGAPPGQERCQRPRRCDGRRPECRPQPAPQGRTGRGDRGRRACGRERGRRSRPRHIQHHRVDLDQHVGLPRDAMDAPHDAGRRPGAAGEGGHVVRSPSVAGSGAERRSRTRLPRGGSVFLRCAHGEAQARPARRMGEVAHQDRKIAPPHGRCRRSARPRHRRLGATAGNWPGQGRPREPRNSDAIRSRADANTARFSTRASTSGSRRPRISSTTSASRLVETRDRIGLAYGKEPVDHGVRGDQVAQARPRKGVRLAQRPQDADIGIGAASAGRSSPRDRRTRHRPRRPR